MVIIGRGEERGEEREGILLTDVTHYLESDRTQKTALKPAP